MKRLVMRKQVPQMKTVALHASHISCTLWTLHQNLTQVVTNADLFAGIIQRCACNFEWTWQKLAG